MNPGMGMRSDVQDTRMLHMSRGLSLINDVASKIICMLVGFFCVDSIVGRDLGKQVRAGRIFTMFSVRSDVKAKFFLVLLGAERFAFARFA